MRRVLKYGTGEKIPYDAKYLTTVIEIIKKTRLVWHYFLVEEKVEEKDE